MDNPEKTLNVTEASIAVLILVESDARKVKALLHEAGILQEDETLSMKAYRAHFVDIVYVILGQLWPKQVATRVCTCKWHGLYAHCQHRSWANGMQWPGFPSVRNHEQVQEHKKRGRPRKTASHAPQATLKRTKTSGGEAAATPP